MASSLPKFKNPRHTLAWRLLESLDAAFLADAHCYFGGGTRIVLELDEYRHSADIDFLCADNKGYRQLRNTITDTSLGRIVKDDLPLMRAVRADRYGIRAAVNVGGEPVKFEIISEGRVSIRPDATSSFPVQPLDAVSCFTQKFLANADRWGDRSFLSRDIIDLAFMMRAWSAQTALVGLYRAVDCYGEVVTESAFKAISALRERQHYRHCLTELAVKDSRKLQAGLRRLMRMLGEAK